MLPRQHAAFAAPEVAEANSGSTLITPTNPVKAETAASKQNPIGTIPTSAPSSAAQKLYASAQDDLLQLRVLLKNGHSQSSVGSGFLIGTTNLVITNFHVVSQIALEPETYFGEFKDTRGKSGTLELLAVDVQHDLAIVRINRQGTGIFTIPETPITLNQGEHLYSLGNPLDLGFTISEGTYNGITHRGFGDQFMFTGPVNPGMSGGPNVTATGQVAGINVAHRRDGELVSFLVPARYAQALLATVTTDSKPPEDFKPVIGEQLLEHQRLMMDTLLETPLSIKKLGPYSVPVRESEQVRCWGSSDGKTDKSYRTNQINCAMESSIFVSENLQTGHISMRHQFITSVKLNALRFSSLMGKFFSNEVRGNTKDETLTTPHCAERFIGNNNFSARGVVCVEAYQKFSGLYNFAIITASTDEPLMNLQSQLILNGVSYENGHKFATQYLATFAKDNAQTNTQLKQTSSMENSSAPHVEHAPIDNSENKNAEDSIDKRGTAK
ncbi:MAG: serine protease [Moraxellaceae bacterium]|nr:MAG: serine protease [Moraxellaceae bacterium]